MQLDGQIRLLARHHIEDPAALAAHHAEGTDRP
jgi:hypothetical protein